MRKKKFYKQPSKYADEACIIQGTRVVSIVDKIDYPDGKFKTVFECESSTGKPRRCVYWSKVDLEVDDKVNLRGRFVGDVFLCWGIQIIKSTPLSDFCNTTLPPELQG